MKKSKRHNQIEHACLVVIAILIVIAYTGWRSHLLARWHHAAKGTIWEPIIELISLDER